MAEATNTRIDQLLHQPAFPFVLDGLAVALFSWPILRSPPASPASAYLYLFAVWGAVIFVLWLMARRAMT
jgi:hypothetical protein